MPAPQYLVAIDARLAQNMLDAFLHPVEHRLNAPLCLGGPGILANQLPFGRNNGGFHVRTAQIDPRQRIRSRVLLPHPLDVLNGLVHAP